MTPTCTRCSRTTPHARWCQKPVVVWCRGSRQGAFRHLTAKEPKLLGVLRNRSKFLRVDVEKGFPRDPFYFVGMYFTIWPVP